VYVPSPISLEALPSLDFPSVESSDDLARAFSPKACCDPPWVGGAGCDCMASSSLSCDTCAPAAEALRFFVRRFLAMWSRYWRRGYQGLGSPRLAHIMLCLIQAAMTRLFPGGDRHCKNNIGVRV
jgi:hypothetical protein